MSDDLERAVDSFVEEAETVYHEYDEGYLDPDAALSRLGDHISDLREAHENEA